jgi:glycosyltransferase involved in cell wall biosynthesis
MARFCEQIWPVLRSRRPNVKLLIIGADPSPEMRKLGDLPGVTVTGSVPDVRPFVRQSAVMVAPLNIARGTQNKILEAMAMGVPVVTSRVAAGGVDAESVKHFLVADTCEEYSAAILRILDDPAERQRLAVAGRQRMLSNHAWPHSMARLDEIIDRCIRNFSQSKGKLA